MPKDIRRPFTISLSDEERTFIETKKADSGYRSYSDLIRHAVRTLFDPVTVTTSAADAIEKTRLWIDTERPVLDPETFVRALEYLAIYCRHAYETGDRVTINAVARRLRVILRDRNAPHRRKKRFAGKMP